MEAYHNNDGHSCLRANSVTIYIYIVSSIVVRTWFLPGDKNKFIVRRAFLVSWGKPLTKDKEKNKKGRKNEKKYDYTDTHEPVDKFISSKDY